MFLHLSVILFTGDGVYPSIQWGGAPQADTHWTPHPWADTLPGQTPPEMATEAGGTHPTGMHSSYYRVY